MFLISDKKNKSDKPLISAVSIAYVIGNILYFVAIAQLIITVVYPVASKTSRFDVYSRNISAIVSFAILGIYLTCWSVFQQKKHHSHRSMKIIKIITISVIVCCIFKSLMAIYYIATQINSQHYSWLYYVAEFLAWAGLTVYFITYLKSKHRKKEIPEDHHHHKHHLSEREMKMEKVAKDQL